MFFIINYKISNKRLSISEPSETQWDKVHVKEFNDKDSYECREFSKIQLRLSCEKYNSKTFGQPCTTFGKNRDF